MSSKIICIDGSYGESGGQIIRTAVALSAITQKPIKVFNIRKGRPNPGLAAQHLTGLLAAAEMCNAKLRGAALGSETIEFHPQKIRGGKYTFDVGTAGAVTLVLQTILPIAMFAERESTLEISGGTDVRMAPTISFFQEILNYYLTKIGAHVIIENVEHGFYPKGGGSVRVRVLPKQLNPLVLDVREALLNIKIKSTTSKSLSASKIAEREIASFKSELKDYEVREEVSYVNSICPGTSLLASAEFNNCKLGASVVGDRGVTSEELGKQCAESLLEELNSDATVDCSTADQLLIFLAFTGGEFVTSKISSHIKTTMWVIEKFQGEIFEVNELKIKVKNK